MSAAAARAPAAKAKRAANNRTYYLAHRERILAKNRAWSQTHAERIAELRAARAGEQRAEQTRARAQARPTEPGAPGQRPPGDAEDRAARGA